MSNHATIAPGSDTGENQASQLTSPTALRKLVLNYLVHHCYTDTAQAFAHDGISSSSTHVKTEDEGEASSSSMANGSRWNSNSQRKTTSSSSQQQHTPPYPVASTSSSSSHAPQTRSSSRLAGQQAAHQAHPLSAPPLSREDSGMEIEVDSLLSLAGAREENGSVSSISNGRHIKKEEGDEEEEDTWMGQTAEQELDSDELSIGELRLVRIRKEIKEHILEGRIRQAIDLCNAQFPTVLNSDPSSPSVWEAEQGRAVRSVVKEREVGNGSSSDSPRVLPANPTSLYAAHLSLNLQIQAFIESVRTASHSVSSSSANGASMSMHGSSGMTAPSHSVAASAPGIASAAAAASAANVVSRSASPAPSSTSSTGSIASANGMSGSNHSNGSTAVINPVLHAALSHAQMLFANVQKLPGYWRAMYLKELESVTALLAYTDLESSPLRKYLDQSRRIALAEQINSAIMFRAGKPSQPLIESAVRQTSFLWSTLSSEKIVVPTDHPIFTSGTVVGLDKFESQTSSGGNNNNNTISSTADRSKVKGKVLPSWNLHSFLLER